MCEYSVEWNLNLETWSPSRAESRYLAVMESVYREEIESWKWESIVWDCENNVETDFDGDKLGYCYLGTVFSLYPGGKYWTCFAAGNMTDLECLQDTAFTEALESVASDNGLWIESGEGDPCDLYAVLRIEES